MITNDSDLFHMIKYDDLIYFQLGIKEISISENLEIKHRGSLK